MNRGSWRWGLVWLGLMGFWSGVELVGWSCDWPQHLGPQRNGLALPEATMPKRLTGELAPAWSCDCGQGYAGVAMAGGRVIVFDRVASSERVRCLELESGKEIWQQSLEAEYGGGFDPDSGPRCVPTIVGDKVVVYGAAGRLSVLAMGNGEVVWTRPLAKEWQAELGYFGAGSAPLVVGDRIVVNVGSKRKSGIVAVELATGRDVWSGFPSEASYAAPIALRHTFPNVSQPILVATRLTAYGIDAVDGRAFFEFPFGMRGPTVNAATPIELSEGQLFLTASYGIGAYLMDAKSTPIQAIYSEDSNLLASQYATPIWLNGRVYASDGREDMGTTHFKCFDPATRKVLWEEGSIGVAHAMGVGAQVLVVGVDGTVWVLGTDTDRFDKRSEGKLPQGVYRALPALSQGTLVVRDSGHANAQKIHAFR